MASQGYRRRFLMCEPVGYGANHVLNEWMRWDESVDVARAIDQWLALRDALERVGADVEVMSHRGRSGAMTFTRDTALVTAPGKAVILRNHGRRGDLEPEHVRRWLGVHGFEVSDLEHDQRLDGGNVVPASDGWLIGIPPGANAEGVRTFAHRLRASTGVVVHGIPIADPRYGHLDTALSDLGGRGWLAHPPAFLQPDLTSTSWAAVLHGRPVIEVTNDEAESLACNVVVVDDYVVGGLTPRLCRAIDRLGLEAVPVDLDEFRKAGGGAHCLTLELDPIHTTDPDRPSPTPSPERSEPCPTP